MKIFLDCSPAKIEDYSKRYNYNFGQLRTPLTAYALSGKQYGLDNGCFSKFESKSWLNIVMQKAGSAVSVEKLENRKAMCYE